MIASADIAVVLLAAGLSSRFGEADKLSHPLGPLPLGLHAARTLAAPELAARIATRIAVVRDGGPDFARFGFTPVINPEPARGQSASLRLGLAEARRAQPRAVLVALADMPFVTTAHFAALLAARGPQHRAVGSSDGHAACPPAVFDASLFPALADLSGDAGARRLLRDALLVHAPPGELADVDTLADLPGAAPAR